MPVERIKSYLEKCGVDYKVIKHRPGYTAQEIAEAAHIPGREVAKTVMVKINGSLAMVVLPASMKLDLEKLKEVAGASEVFLASEEEFQASFPDCEVGAIPPLGKLFGLPEYVDEALTDDESIAFSAGTHSELIQMPYAKFEELTSPTVASLHA